MTPLTLAISRTRLELIPQLWSTTPGEEESNGELRRDDSGMTVIWEKSTPSTI
jgi:hypothetical protein